MPPQDRAHILGQASAVLTEQLLKAPNFDAFVDESVRILDKLGHKLRLFDSDFNVDLDREETSQVWCGDWTEPAGDSTPLVISFHSERGVEMEWSER